MLSLLRCFTLVTLGLWLTACSTLGEPSAEKPPAPASVAPVTALPATHEAPQKIALLLPLQGPLGSAGQAIRDGFITAYNNDNSATKPIHIAIIDDSEQPIIEAYKKAVNTDADLIVGPLAKNNVQTLIQANSMSVPTLALNYLDTDAAAPANLYQFGLSPLDEARQAAALAHQNGGQTAIIIAPANSWGQTLAQAYQDEWQALGGDVIHKLYFSHDSDELNQQIRNLAVAYKQKADVILLAASPAMARQIKPLLKFYDAGNLPVYATALVYSGTPQPAFDNDLNGITFCDMPWTLNNNSSNSKLRQQIALFWPVNFKQNARLYALGIDAYQLSKQLPQLTESQQTITGVTGNLLIDKQKRVVRQLTCSQFVTGAPDSLSIDHAVDDQTDE